MFTIPLFGQQFDVLIKVGTYVQGGTSIQLVCVGGDDDGLEFATVSVRLPQSELLPPDKFYVKHWSENEPIVKAMLDQKLLAVCHDVPTAASGHVAHIQAFCLTPTAQQHIQP